MTEYAGDLIPGLVTFDGESPQGNMCRLVVVCTTTSSGLIVNICVMYINKGYKKA